MREQGNGSGIQGAAGAKNAQSELPALLLPQPRPPRIEDPDRGDPPVVEPEDRPPAPEEARGKPKPDHFDFRAGGKSA